MNRPIQVEIIYRGLQCASSIYMAEAIEEMQPKYGQNLRVRKVEFMKSKEDSCRLYELSVSLYGEKAVREQQKIAPIPSLFIEGQLVFDMIPPRYELEQALEYFLLLSRLPDPTEYHS